MAKKVREDADKTSDDRDDLIEAGKRLRQAKAIEAQSSGLGVKARKQTWTARRGKK